MKALVVGGATIDVIATINPDDIECITMSNATNSYLLMEQGAKVEAEHIDTQLGGGATNASVSMSRLGADVGIVLKLGKDMDGDHVIDRLTGESVDTGFVLRHETEPTGKSVIVCSHDRNSGVFVNRGANTKLHEDDIKPEMFEGVDVVYVSTLSSYSADAFPKIVRLAKEAGAFVACNPGIRQIRQRKEQVLHALQWVDLIAVNKEEATALAEGTLTPHDIEGPFEEDAPKLIRNGLGEKNAPFSIKEFAEKVHALGTQYLVVTNGAEGAYLGKGKRIYFCPTIPCKLESTIGAGDAFNSTLTWALASGTSITESMMMAVTNAASVAEKIDAQSGLLTHDALMDKKQTLYIYTSV